MISRQILALAWRESRFARKRLLLFLSAISLGVAALVAVEGFARNLERGVERESKALLGADLRLESRQPFGPVTSALVDSLSEAGVPVARVTSFASMVLHRGSGGTRLAQVRAAEPGYPFYGEIETDPVGRWEALHQGRSALADPALIAALGAQIGDSISVGEAQFQLIGALTRVPGDVEIASSFAPRLYIPAAHVEETALLAFGSRVDHAVFIALPDAAQVDRLLEGHRTSFQDERVRTETAAGQQRDIAGALSRLSSYLGLVGIFALLLGGIGVASAMGAYIAEKTDSIAVLRCLGATAGQVLAVYVAQAAVMGLVGALLGAAAGGAVQWVLPWLARDLLPVQATVTVDAVSIVVGIAVGLWTAVVFALLPLIRIRAVSPLGALRRRVEPLPVSPRDPLRWGVLTALCASILILLVAQVDSIAAGVAVAAGVGITVLLLDRVARLVIGGVRRFPRERFVYPVRQGIANLHRPGNQTRTVTVALGFGVFLLASLLLIQHNLLAPLRIDDEAGRPNLLFWDVQDDQVGELAGLLEARGLPVVQQAPTVPMRIAAIHGEEIQPGRTGEEAERGDQPERWAVRREYRSTYRDSLMPSELLRRGDWWDGPGEMAEDGTYPVSLEVDIAGDLRVGLGDRIVWDVQGVRVATRVASLREVDWARFEPNFFAVFPPAALAGAPRTWIVLSQGESAEARAVIQRDAVARFPNIAVVDLTQLQEAVDRVLGQVSAVIRFLATFSIATGFVVLLGSVAITRLQRIRESVLLKTIGATRRQVGVILFTEYLVLGLLAALTGIILSIAAAWSLTRWFFEMRFEVAVAPLVSLAVGVAGVAVVVGIWASREVFHHTPLEAIREE